MTSNVRRSGIPFPGQPHPGPAATTSSSSAPPSIERRRSTPALEAEVAELRLQVGALTKTVQQLLESHRGRARGIRDAADSTLLETLAKQIGSRLFTSAELLQHGQRVDPVLLEALHAVDVVTVEDLGVWLRRMKNVAAAGRVLRRGRLVHGTRRWWVDVVDIEVKASARGTLTP